MFLGVLMPAQAPKELAEPKVGVGNVRSHAKLGPEHHCLAIVSFGVVTVSCECHVASQDEGVSLASVRPEMAGERERRFRVAGGLGDPPGREVGRPRKEK